MLSRLYNPFLWRSLKVANVYVRANAATLFLDAFPLQDPDSSREEIDAAMQKQFDAMTVRIGREWSCMYPGYRGVCVCVWGGGVGGERSDLKDHS
jgi:hypothetical protein